MERVTPEEIMQFFVEKKTYQDISVILQNRFPEERGFSVTSIKRFCKSNGLSPRMSNAFVNDIVSKAVEEVCIIIINCYIYYVIFY